MSKQSKKAQEKKAETLKEDGNKAFAAKNYALAAKHFSEALEIEPTNHTFLSNRSAAYTKLEKYDLALEDANKCLELQPDWGKGYARKGLVLFLLGKYEESVAVYAQGLAKDPANESLTEGLQAAQKKLAAKKKKKKGGKSGREEKLTAEEAKNEQAADKKYETVIGIDLGTTYSCVGVWENDGVKIISNAHGDRTTPSYVSFQKNGERVVGQPAKALATTRPTFTIFDIKRIIGQRYSHPGVAQDIRRFPFEVIKGEDDKPMVKIPTDGEKKLYAPEEISAMVLQDLKATAETYLGHPVTKAVITVPAYFNDAQRAATKAAGAIAGLEVLRIINEPTAAALSYGLDNVSKDKIGATNVLIFDLGGGTFDVSILSIEGGLFTVKATGGDTRLGGEDFDHNLVEYLLLMIEKEGIPDPRTNPKAMRRIRVAAEKAKRELSEAQQTDIVLENLVEDKNFTAPLLRAKFESLNQGYFSICLDTVKRVLKDAKMKNDDIHEIVLVGGSTRIPKIQTMLQEFFNGRQLCKSVNPDEAVAYGAAVQGAILSGRRNKKTDDVLLMDITPLSLGIETTGGVMSVIIPRNSPIPCIKTQTYTTEHNYQSQVDISVYEGERLQTEFNHLLGEFTITGIERAKRGEPQIEVTFEIDSNGILGVKARDKKTGAEAKIQIAKRGTASEQEVKKMVAEAEKFRKLDQDRMRRVEAKNSLESLVLEAMEVAEGLQKKQPKLAQIIRTAAEKEQEFLDGLTDEVETKDINARRRALERRIQGKG